MKVLRAIDNALAKIGEVCAWVSGAALFLMALLIFTNVILRYFFHHAISGADEVVTLMMVFVVYFALSKSTRIRAHVRVDFITNMLPETIRYIVLGITALLCIFVTANISIRTFGYAGKLLESGAQSQVLKITFAPFYYVISVMNVFLSFEFLADGLKYFGQSAAAFKAKNLPAQPAAKKEEQQ